MDTQKRKINGGHVKYEQSWWLETFDLSLTITSTRDALFQNKASILTNWSMWSKPLSSGIWSVSSYRRIFDAKEINECEPRHRRKTEWENIRQNRNITKSKWRDRPSKGIAANKIITFHCTAVLHLSLSYDYLNDWNCWYGCCGVLATLILWKLQHRNQNLVILILEGE